MTTVEEWRSELQRLRWLPGHDGVATTFWRGFLRQAREGRTGPRMRPNMRYLTPRERIEANQGYELAKGTQILRCGKRSYYVVEPDSSPDASTVRVY